MNSREEEHREQTFSQEGEDVLLRRMIKSLSPGFYIDVGAYHPYRFSNTHILHRNGWRGINIDANPQTKALFDQARPHDVNLEAVVSDEDGVLIKFDLFTEPAYNSAIVERREAYLDLFVETIEKPAVTLRTIVERHLPQGLTVDLLTIDVEGWEIQVLRGNDWTRVRPSYVIAETEIDLENATANPIVAFMSSVGYKLRSYLYLSAVFTPAERGFW